MGVGCKKVAQNAKFLTKSLSTKYNAINFAADLGLVQQIV